MSDETQGDEDEHSIAERIDRAHADRPAGHHQTGIRPSFHPMTHKNAPLKQ